MLKHVALIDDVCSFGKCSIGVALPILSSAGIEVYPAVTAIFSAHTPIEHFTKLSTKQIFTDSLNNWKTQKVKFDAIYTGALSDKAQVYSCLELFADQPDALKIVDPVLGDNGDFYDKNFEALLPHMKLLIAKADIITPNVTEAQLLAGTTSSDPNQLLLDLRKFDAKNIVLTGVVESDQICNYVLNEDGSIHVSPGKYVNSIIHGAGDMFGSSMIAAMVQGKSLHEATDFAAELTSKAAEITIKDKGYEKKGILFEPLLKYYQEI